LHQLRVDRTEALVAPDGIRVSLTCYTNYVDLVTHTV
jgi:hypothetical protein